MFALLDTAGRSAYSSGNGRPIASVFETAMPRSWNNSDPLSTGPRGGRLTPIHFDRGFS
jgi:hypothetical protein